MARPVSRAELARLFGVSRPAVTKRCQGAWAAACEGDRVDLDHPLIQAAAQKKGLDIGKPARGPTPSVKKAPAAPASLTKPVKSALDSPSEPTARRRGAEPKPELPEQPDNAGSLEDLRALSYGLQPYLDRFGTGRAARDWVVFQKDTETTIGRRLANAQSAGEVISREKVKTHVFGALESVNQRLLSDTPKTVARVLYTAARSGQTIEEAEAAVRRLISKQLEGVKLQVIKALKS